MWRLTIRRKYRETVPRPLLRQDRGRLRIPPPSETRKHRLFTLFFLSSFRVARDTTEAL